MSRSHSETGRRKGNIEERGGALRVRLYSGIDPVTGRESYLRATIPGTDDAAWRKAEKQLDGVPRADAETAQCGVISAFRQAVDEWFQQNTEI